MRIIQFLLMQSDVNARDNYNSTPLHFAAVRGNVVAARELLASKDVLVNVRLRLTSLSHQRCVRTQTVCSFCLIELDHAGVLVPSGQGPAGLHAATRRGDVRAPAGGGDADCARRAAAARRQGPLHGAALGLLRGQPPDRAAPRTAL